MKFYLCVEKKEIIHKIGVNMKRIVLIALLAGLMPMSMMAQDDLYFSPSQEKKAEKAARPQNSNPNANNYWIGSKRSSDEYNHYGHYGSSYQNLGRDSLGNDVVMFDKGMHPDTTYIDTAFANEYGMNDEDYRYARSMSRWDGYYDPWLYDEYGWGPYFWRAPYWAWDDPWYGGYYWGDPWFYGSYWGNPWFYGYGWGGYNPWYYGYWGGPWYGYGWGWGGPAYVYDNRDYGHMGGLTGNRNWSRASGNNYSNNNRSGNNSNYRTYTTGRTNNFGGRTYNYNNNTSNRSFGTSRSTSSPSFGNNSFGGGRSGGSFSGGGFGGGHSGGSFGGGHFGSGRR
jgi:hypothetical protein